MTSSPSADDKRLAENVVGMNDRFIEATRKRLARYRAEHPGNEDTAEEILLRFLDASRARLAEAESNVQKATTCLAETEDELKAAEERASALEKALTEARNAINACADEAWGFNMTGDPTIPGGSMSWPIKDELLHYIDKALSPAAIAAPPAKPPS